MTFEIDGTVSNEGAEVKNKTAKSFDTFICLRLSGNFDIFIAIYFQKLK